jgi:hypothetical protein
MSTIRPDREEGDQSFGLVGIASLGSILSLLLLGVFTPGRNAAAEAYPVGAAAEITGLFDGIGGVVADVSVAISPILVIFLILQLRALHIRKKQFLLIMKGVVLFYAGLVFLLQGIHVAFVPVGEFIGNALAAMERNWILIPLGFVMGFLVAFAEPAVHVMINQVEELTSGAIRGKVMLAAISLGVAAAVALGMARLLYGIPLWYIVVPGYILAFILSHYVDTTFVGMAFDNGGVSTGPMCSTFLLAMGLAVSNTLSGGKASYADGFGLVSLIALAPVLTTMALGFLYQRKHYKKQKRAAAEQQAESATASGMDIDTVEDKV